MDCYGHHPTHLHGVVPPPRISSLPSADLQTLSSASRSSETSSMRSARSGLGFEVDHRVNHESAKPRLSKEQQDVLEKHFREQPKPSTQTKRNFADSLGVPIEKINNWFQNRRAKVKQDAKKRQPTFHGYCPNAYVGNGSMSANPCFVDGSFYHGTDGNLKHTTAGRSATPALQAPEYYEPLVNTNTARFGVPLETSGISLDQQAMDPSPQDDRRVFDTFFGLQNDSHLPNNYDLDDNALFAFSKQFSNGGEPFNGMMGVIPEHNMFQASPAENSRSTSSSQPNGLEAERPCFNLVYPLDLSHLSAPPDFDQLGSGLNGEQHFTFPSWGQGVPLQMPFGADGSGVGERAVFPSQHPPQLPFRVEEGPSPKTVLGGEAENFLQQNGQNQPQSPHEPVTAIPMDVKQSNSEDSGPLTAKVEPSPQYVAPLPQAAGQIERRDSVVSTLADTVRNLEDQAAAGFEPPILKHTIGYSSLAARRQRKPTPLGSVGARSSSASSTTPASPNTAGYAHASDANASLRRIKSSIGPGSGRIQKSGASSAQRSPLPFNFAEGMSPRYARSISNHSAAAVSADTSGFNSPLPSSRMQAPLPEMEGISEHSQNSRPRLTIPETDPQAEDAVWTNVSTSTDTTTASVWSYMPQTSTSFAGANSPPETPQHYAFASDEYGQYQAPVSGGLFHAPSAPAWQQSFSVAAPPQHLYAQQLPPGMVPIRPEHHFHPPPAAEDDTAGRLHEFNNEIAFNEGGEREPTFNQPNASVSTAPTSPERQAKPSSPTQQQLQEQQPSQPQPHQTPQQSHQFMFRVQQHESPNGPTGSGQQRQHGRTVSTSPQKPPPGELTVLEFSPREPADPSKLPPKSRHSQPPRQFEFHNSGPDAFSSSSP